MADNTLFEKHTELFSGDIGMYYCGKRTGTKNHIYGPEIRSHFLLVLVEKGSATLYKEDGNILFKEKDMLIMFPEEKIFYKAHTDWTIKWIGVSGSQVEEIFKTMGITRKHPILTLKNYEEILKIMADIYETKFDSSIFTKYKIQSLLYNFFAVLLSEENKKTPSDPIESALQIIKYNYNNDLNIKDIADSLFLDSAYFSRLFKSKTGISPKKYISEMRIKKAEELLSNTDCHIKEISVTVGFSDPLYFSKLFYKNVGMSPSEYRKTKNAEQQI